MEVELKPLTTLPEQYDQVEEKIRELFKAEIYLPLLAELGVTSKVLKNATDDLIQAISSGRIAYHRGQFTGRFDSVISKELRKLGAKWDKKQGSFAIPLSKLPISIKRAIAASEAKFEKTMSRIESKLKSMIPEEIAARLKIDKLLDETLWKVEKDFQKKVQGLIVTPKLDPEQKKRLKSEYTNNMELDIKTWTEKEIIALRKQMHKHTMSGQRYEGMISTIQARYGVSKSKAKFLAGQETRLLINKYKELRFQDAGSRKYRWKCVVGSPLHPVRPRHKELDGKIFEWDNPPIVSEPGQKERRANAGSDFNCRCHAIPIVEFQKS